MKTKQELKQYFENGDIPKQEEFWDWQESYWHKDEKVPQESISGLTDSLKTKLNAPSSTGSGFYFLAHNSPWTTYQRINLDSYFLTSWNGSNFVSSNLYYNNGKLGIGTNMPTEVFQVEGNIKTQGLILSNPQYIPSNIDAPIRSLAIKNDGTIGWTNGTADSLNHIPLSGTEQNRPITGDLIIDNSNGNKEIKGAVHGSHITFLDDGVININNVPNISANVKISGIDIFGTDPLGKGLEGSYYYGTYYQDNSFIQKKYADKQQSYSKEEQKTGGLWINKKPIYRKTVVFTEIPRNGIIELDKHFGNMEVIVSNQMFTEWYNMDAAFSGNQFKGLAFISLDTLLATIELKDTPDYNYSNIESFTLTIEYTKKNDLPVV